MKLGFPTGKLKDITLSQAFERNVTFGGNAVEFSALRYEEFETVIDQLEMVDIPEGWACSLHAPSAYPYRQEEYLVDRLANMRRQFPIVLHPDVVKNFSNWRPIQKRLRIENMDLRHPLGQTVGDIDYVFSRLPQARFCFDIGHARQVDPTMKLARDMHEAFRCVLDEIHISVVADCGKHERMTPEAAADYAQILRAEDHVATAVIIEVPLEPDEAAENVALVGKSFS